MLVGVAIRKATLEDNKHDHFQEFKQHYRQALKKKTVISLKGHKHLGESYDLGDSRVLLSENKNGYGACSLFQLGKIAIFSE